MTVPIKLIKGDLFSTSCDVIAHGCNVKGGFSSGVAGQISKRHPEVREAYLYKFKRTGWTLGSIQTVKIDRFISGYPLYLREPLPYEWVVNIATQENYGRDGKLYANYTAISNGLDSVLAWCEENEYSLAMPKIGCGLAGGEWSIVLDIVAKLSAKYPSVDIEIYYL